MKLFNRFRRPVAPAQPVTKIIKKTRYSQQSLTALRKPEPTNIAEIVAAMLPDYQVQLAIRVLGGNIKAANSVVGAADNAGTRAGLLARKLQKLWDQTLPAMLDSIPFGRVAFEKVWEYRTDVNLNYIEELDPLPFANTAMRLVDGKFDGINFREDDKKDPIRIPPANSLWLGLDASALEPHGRSRFLGAPFTVWQERRDAIALRKIFVKKLMVGGGRIAAPFETEIENNQTIDVAAALADMHAARRAGDLLVMPNVRDAQGHPLFEFQEGVTLNDPTPIDDHIDGLDQDQLQSFGVPPKTVLEGASTGSYAMVSQQMLTLFAVCEDILKQCENSFQQHVIDATLASNFEAGTGPTITISHQPMVERPDGVLVDICKAALAAPQLNPILTSGIISINELLRAAGVPVSANAQRAENDMIARARQEQTVRPAVPAVSQ